MITVFFMAGIVAALQAPLSLNGQEPAVSPPRAGSCSLLVIRVEFEPDTDPATTGDGLFEIRTPADSQAEPFLYDYFVLFGLEQKESPFRTPGGAVAFPYYTLNEYFREISGDLFRLETITVTPDIYVTQGKEMAYYGANVNQEARLCELADTALLLAQNDYDFSQYDYIAILHAGAGEEFDMNRDSPDDILTTALTPAAYEEITGTPLRNDVANGVMIIPETEDQDSGPDDMPLSTLGPAAFSLGTLMGMPTTYDLSGRSSGVGMWDLMGYGFSHYLGFLPMPPCGYIKVSMGWADPVLLDSKGDLSLDPFSCDVKEDLWNGNHLYKIIIGEGEYFLLEYRNGQGIGGAFQAFTYLGRQGDHYVMEPSEKALPGITIWHVNEEIISLDPDNLNGSFGKGLDLEEADGLNDLDRAIGEAGSLGDRLDCFNSGTWDIFTDETSPSARDSRGARSGIRLTDLTAETAAGNVTVGSQRPDYFPLAFPGLLQATQDFFVTSSQVYASDGLSLFSFEGEIPLLLDKTVLFTDEHLYSLPGGEILQTWSTFFGEALLEARRENGYYFLRTVQRALLWDEAFTLVASEERPETAFLGVAGVHKVSLSAGILYVDEVPILEGVEDIRLYDGEIFTAAEGLFYSIDPEDPAPSLFGASPDGVSDFFPLDYDRDGVTELFALTPERLVILNETGPEKSYFLPGSAEMAPFEKDGKVCLLLTGEKTILLDTATGKQTLYTGQNIRLAGGDGGNLFYGNEDIIYGLTLYDRLLRQGSVLVPPGEGVLPPIEEKAVYAYPNPVEGETLFIRFSARSGEKVHLSLYNAAMQELKKKTAVTVSGENNVSLSLRGVASGTYLIRLKTGDKTHFLKVIRL